MLAYWKDSIYKKEMKKRVMRILNNARRTRKERTTVCTIACPSIFEMYFQQNEMRQRRGNSRCNTAIHILTRCASAEKVVGCP